jgi:DNA polymerase-3 subunit gamma/tau
MSKKLVSKKPKTLESYNLPEKYRPTKLSDYIGQTSAQNTMSGWLERKRFPSTILISGLTGSGKTTLAKMIARYVNCEKNTACGKCDACKFSDDQIPDLIEINAGEAGNIDDIRNLLQRAKRTPRFNKQIILIDEAHLLSDKAESTLLVPLEKPSKNCIWILCTTNPEKLKNTIRNRCTHITLNPISAKEVYARLEIIVREEGLKIKDKDLFKKCLKRIAELCEGQMRNAISMLDTLISIVSSGNKYDESVVSDLGMQATEEELNSVSAEILVAVLGNNLLGIVKNCKGCKEPRKLISQLRYLIDWQIESITGIAKYVPAIGKLFVSSVNKNKVKVSLPALLKVQSVLLDVDHKILTVPAYPAAVALYTALADLSVDDYFNKVKK